MRVKMVITGLVAIVWLGSIYSLHKRTAARSFLEQGARVDVVTEEFILREDYLGLYLNDQKIGYTTFILKEAGQQTGKAAGSRAYLFKAKSVLRIQALGLQFPVTIYSSGSVNDDLELMDFSFTFESSGQLISSVGSVEGDVLRVTTKSEGSEQVKEYPLSGPIFSPDIVHLVVARKGLAIGKEWSFPIYDPLTTSRGDIVVRVEDRETIEWSGSKQETFRITLSYKGFQEEAWVDSNGDIYRERSSIGGISFVALREPKEEARRLEIETTVLADLIEDSRIPVEYEIERPELVKRMTAEVSGCKPEDVLYDGLIQSLDRTNDDGTFVITIRKPDYRAILAERDTPTIAYNGAQYFPQYLDPEPLIQSADERIQQKALEITRGAASRWEAVERISTWLHNKIRKEIRVTIPSALEVLATLRGDCNEHATLFAGLARSLGIPTRICSGVVYQNRAFYYHAWNEVLIGDEDPVWLPVDSTLGRTEVDATHIKLNEGSLDQQVGLVRLIGQMSLRILDIS